MKAWLAAFLFLLFSATGALAVGPDPALDWRSLDTPHFRIHFPLAARSSAVAAARIAEAAHERVSAALEWTPGERTDIVLFSGVDIANGFATPFPFSHSGIYLSPPDEGELLQNEDWLRLVIEHEYVHIVHMDKVAGAPSVLRAIFGRLPWFFPNVLQPSWLLEGLATWMESAPTQKIGRWRNSHFEAQMRAEVQGGLKSLRELNANGRGFPFNRAYLYGAYFFGFLSDRYGAAAPFTMVANYSRNLIPFRVHNAPLSATGKQMDVLWDEYLAWLKERFGSQLARLDATPGAAGKTLLHAYSLADPAQAADGTRYYVRGDGLTRAQVVRRVPGGDDEALLAIDWNARLAAGPAGQLLAVMHDIVGNYDLTGDLYHYAPDTGWSRLTTGGRIRLAAFVPDGQGFIAVQGGDDALRIVRLDRRGEVVATLATLEPGQTVSGIDVAPLTGEVVWTQNRERRWQLVAWRPGSGISLLLDDPAIKHSPRFSLDDGRLYLVADYDNVPNIWGLDETRQHLQRQSHTRTAIIGLARPRGGETVGIELAPDGERLLAHAVRAAKDPTAVQAAPAGAASVPADGAPGAPSAPSAPSVPAPAPENASAVAPTGAPENPPEALPEPFLPTDHRPVVLASAARPAPPAPPPVGPDRAYSPWASLPPRAWFPSLLAADGALAVGIQIYGQDAVGWHQYTASPLLETTQGELLGAFDYAYDERHFFALTRDMIVRLTSGARKSPDIRAYSIAQKGQWLSLLPYERLAYRLALGVGGTFEREHLTFVDGPRWRLYDERLGALLLRYDSRTRQRWSEGPSQGLEATFFVEDYDVFASPDYAGKVLRFDGRAFVPLGSTVLGLNYREGRADATARGFVLGGRKVAADVMRVELGERDYALRGYASGVASGQRVRLGSVEWRFPIADVDRHLMVPPVGINRVSGNLFWESGAAWNADQTPQYQRAVGVEVLAELRLGYLMELQLRAGIARALDGAQDTRGYLTLGRAF